MEPRHLVGMGLIMLILIGSVPTVCALNRAMEPARVEAFAGDAEAVTKVLAAHAGTQPAIATDDEAPKIVGAYVRTRTFEPATVPGLIKMVAAIDSQVRTYETLTAVPNEKVNNVRNDMYLVSEAFRHMLKLKPAGSRATKRM